MIRLVEFKEVGTDKKCKHFNLLIGRYRVIYSFLQIWVKIYNTTKANSHFYLSVRLTYLKIQKHMTK